MWTLQELSIFLSIFSFFCSIGACGLLVWSHNASHPSDSACHRSPEHSRTRKCPTWADTSRHWRRDCPCTGGPRSPRSHQMQSPWSVVCCGHLAQATRPNEKGKKKSEGQCNRRRMTDTPDRQNKTKKRTAAEVIQPFLLYSILHTAITYSDIIVSFSQAFIDATHVLVLIPFI